jgi:nucleotide-binding universal stress UspA family protein
MWSYPPRKILVPVDFGDASARALQTAAALAAAHRAAVVVVHAESLEAPPYFTQAQLRAFDRQRAGARKVAERYLAGFVGHHFGGPAETAIVDGPPAEAIARFARKVDLIVMGTHGRRAPARWWAGSVAERIVREATIPVLVVRAAGGAAANVFKHIAVVATDGSHEASALRYARGLAEAAGGDVTPEPATTLEEATQDRTTLLVLANPSGGPALTATANQLLRRCRRPVLFVPPV